MHTVQVFMLLLLLFAQGTGRLSVSCTSQKKKRNTVDSIMPRDKHFFQDFFGPQERIGTASAG